MVEYAAAVADESARGHAYIELNKLYLEIQRGERKLTRRVYDQLNGYLNTVYPANENDAMRAWWYKEFQRLPGWLDV
jgi:hypothetical protein